MLAIEADGLTKHYGTATAVDDLTWSLPAGEACAFLGPNGAGKSTALRMLLGFTPASRGTCRVLGENPWEMAPATRARIGYVAEQSILPPWMRVGALLDFHRSLYPRWNREHERALCDVLEVSREPRVSQLSKGQNRRLALLLALAQDADLLVLDEPGAGLDVAARRQLLSLLGEFLAGEGKTVLFSTHLVTDVERIASRVAVLARGRLVADAELDELHENVKSVRLAREVFERTRERWAAAGLLEVATDERTANLVVRHFATQGRFILRDLAEGEVVVAESDRGATYMGSDGREARVTNLALEDIFLALAGQGEGARG